MERPRIPILPTLADMALEGVAVIITSLSLVYLAMNYGDLPDHVPLKFNYNQPDGFGSKLTLWILPIVGLTMYIGLSILSKFPYIFNYPVEVTRRNVIRQYRLALRLLRWIKTETAIILGLIAFEAIEVANGATPLSPVFIGALTAVMMLTVVIYLIKASRAA